MFKPAPRGHAFAAHCRPAMAQQHTHRQGWDGRPTGAIRLRPVGPDRPKGSIRQRIAEASFYAAELLRQLCPVFARTPCAPPPTPPSHLGGGAPAREGSQRRLAGVVFAICRMARGDGTGLPGIAFFRAHCWRWLLCPPSSWGQAPPIRRRYDSPKPQLPPRLVISHGTTLPPTAGKKRACHLRRHCAKKRRIVAESADASSRKLLAKASATVADASRERERADQIALRRARALALSRQTKARSRNRRSSP